MIDTIEAPARPATSTSGTGNDSNYDELAHIVRGRVDARLACSEGLEVAALCGKRWVPALFFPPHLPVCMVCKDLTRTA